MWSENDLVYFGGVNYEVITSPDGGMVIKSGIGEIAVRESDPWYWTMIWWELPAGYKQSDYSKMVVSPDGREIKTEVPRGLDVNNSSLTTKLAELIKDSKPVTWGNLPCLTREAIARRIITTTNAIIVDSPKYGLMLLSAEVAREYSPHVSLYWRYMEEGQEKIYPYRWRKEVLDGLNPIYRIRRDKPEGNFN